MALATKCPHCGTVFKVAADQLKLRGGIVRCGKCGEVFDGNASLVEPEAAAAPAPSPAPAEEETPVYTVDFDATFEPLGILPKPEEPEAEPEAEPEPEEAAPQLPIDFDLDLTPPPAPAEPEPEPEPEPESHPEREAEAAELVPGAVAMETIHAEAEPGTVPTGLSPAFEPEPPAADDLEEPGFVTRVRKKEKTTRILRVLMAIGSVVLLAGLLAQAAITFGSLLAARYPEAKPLLVEACKVLRCQITLPAQIDTLAIETGELQTIGNDLFSLSTVLRNQSNLVQAWPHIELALTDTTDKTLVRRVITPREYLPPRTDLRKGFAARYEQPVKVYFQLSGVTASGYKIAIFHP